MSISEITLLVVTAIVFWIIGLIMGSNSDPVFSPLPSKDYDHENRITKLEIEKEISRPHDLISISRFVQCDISKLIKKSEEQNFKSELLAEKLGYEWKETIGSGWVKKTK